MFDRKKDEGYTTGVYTEWFQVLREVPQGSVLEPLLFVLFVNKLPKWIRTSIKMFADDTKLWDKIAENLDSTRIQRDLDSF